MTVTPGPDLAASAGRLEDISPGYLERVRRATARLAARPGAVNDPRVALETMAEVTTIDVDIPTASSRRSVRLIKIAVRRLLGWYLRYVGDQVTVMGQAVSRFGLTMVERTEQLGDEAAAQQRELQALADRVGRLEQQAQLAASGR